MEACTRPQQRWPDINFAHEISPQPPRAGAVTITLRITDISGAAIAGAHLTMEGTMSHAGMVPVFAEAKEIEPGHYRSVMQLSMAGDWHVTVHVTLPDSRKADYDFEIKAVEP